MKILFSAHDPGGYNLIEPIIECILNDSRYDVFLALVGPAKKKAAQKLQYKNHIIELITFPVIDFDNELDVEHDYYRKVFHDIDPEIVFVASSINSNIERYTIKFAQESGKANFTYVDSWTGEKIRYTTNEISVIPDNILLCDDIMANPYKFYEDKGSKLHIVGNIHLEQLYQNAKYNLKKSVTKDIILLFVTENIAHYFPEFSMNEFIILKEIIKSYSIDRKIEIRIRPHPLESIELWKNFIIDNASKNRNIRLSLDESSSINSALALVDIVIGISTMALIESAILKIPTFSYQFNIKDKSFLYIPYDLYNIGIIDHSSRLNEIVENFGVVETENKQFRFPFLGAKEKILSLIEGYA